MRIRFAGVLISLLLLFVLPSAADAQTVNGNNDAAFAVGKWKESHEGVTLFCARVTTQKDVIKGNSNGACFLTEAQATAKDVVTMSTNTFAVTTWDDHTLTAVTEFYADKNGDQTSKTSPGAIKFIFRLVLNFETHQMTKFVEASTGNTVGYHLEGQ
jgi:xanthine dehydrogenase iron-sulfur cluster and FAD-binding subunit A